MAQTVNPPPAATVGPEGLRLVLFGLPAAGKSSLLGALGNAATMQQDLLGGTLVDRSQGLAELSQHLFDDHRRTPEEVIPYPIDYQPAAVGGEPPEGPVRALLFDCDGEVANEILGKKRSLEEESPAGSLTREVGDADALLLVVDGSSSPEEIESTFGEFTHFLDSMQQARGKRVEVAGLPVFLVLTKCDLLARPGDSMAMWMDRIEERKREVGARFKAFLTEEQPDPSPAPTDEIDGLTATPFGKLELHVWATAIKRPPLLQMPARVTEPYGVAELFRQALEEARDYRQRCQRSSRRLTWVLASALVLVASMGLLAGLLFLLNVSSGVDLLQSRVEDFRFFAGVAPAERLKGTPETLRRKQLILQEIREDPRFDRLPEESRAFVSERLDELKIYIPYLETLLSQRSLATFRTEQELESYTRKLRGELAPPREDWSSTYAVHLRQDRLSSAEAARRGLQAARNWFLESAEQAGRLWTFADTPAGMIDWADWSTRVDRLLSNNRLPPFRETEPVPGVSGGGMTFGHILNFDRVVEAQASWDLERVRLDRLASIVSALGMAPPTKARPAVLVFPRDLTLEGCKARLAELRLAFPAYQKTFVRDVISEAVLPRVRQVARTQYDVLLTPARAEVLRRLRQAGTGSEETLARWDAVRRWLNDPVELEAWQELARTLLRLDDPSASDPVQGLANFLDRKQFPLEVRSFVLEVPELRGLVPRAEAKLQIHHPESKRQPALTFEPIGEPARNSARRARLYTYRLAEGRRLVYTPGDKLWAELPLRADEGRLMWSQSSSQLYRFGCLLAPPRLQSVEATTLDEGRLLEDVRLIPKPEDGIPALPDLLPHVKLGS